MAQTKKDHVRESILKAAKWAFMTSGFEKASMRGISSKTGYTVGNIYRYYKDKNALFEAVIEELNDRDRMLMLANNRMEDPEFRLEYLDGLTTGRLADIAGGSV